MINEILIEMLKYNALDTRRINHAMKVHAYSKAIAEKEKIDENELLVLELAAILHDIGIKECERKYSSTNGFLQQKEGPLVAMELVEKYNLDANLLKRVLYIIGHHHTYKDVDGDAHQILLEADLIVNTQEGYITQYAFWNAVERLFRTESAKEIARLAIEQL
ncbi:MAG: HD domain-containing protein [Eubacteriales bacterium]